MQNLDRTENKGLQALDSFHETETLFTFEKMERFHTSSLNAKRIQMVQEVIIMEEEGVLNHKNLVFFGIWSVEY